MRKKQNPFLNLSLDCYFLEETHLKKAAKERLVYVHNTYGAKNFKEILFKTSDVVHQKYVCYQQRLPRRVETVDINMTPIGNSLYTSSIFVSVCRCYNSETETLTRNKLCVNKQ